MSGKDGSFALRAQAGSYQLSIRREGFVTWLDPDGRLDPAEPPRTFELAAGSAAGDEHTMTPPVLLGGPNPEYTAKAFNSLDRGWVVVWCVITVSGSVEGCQLLKGLSDDLNGALVRTLERRRYRPALLDGAPIEVDYTFAVHFQLG